MRILTVRNPWAWAIIHGGKDVENRVRNIAGNWRGTIAIHVALKEDVNAFSNLDSETLPALDAAADEWLGTLTAKQAQRLVSVPWRWGFGAIIGVVELVDVHWSGMECSRGSVACHEYGLCSPWAEAYQHHLELANPRPLVEPIPFRGALGLRRLPDDVAAAVRAAAL